MKQLFGAIQASKPEGFLAPVRIDNLVRLDEKTGDGRLLRGSGANVRELPRTIFGGFEEGDPHGSNVPIGRLDAVEFDPENNTATAWGWLLDDEAGQRAARYISTGTLRHNSIHMAEVEVSIDIEENEDDPFGFDLLFTFEKWSVASTTLLGVPAFKDSTFVMEEVKASMTDGYLVVDAEQTDVEIEVTDPEITASADEMPLPPRDYFFVREPSGPQGIEVSARDERGFRQVTGHLAQWNTCHDGIAGRCVIAPRPRDEYASFHQGSVLTEGGPVRTGPIFFKYGHPDHPLGEGDVHKAYGGVENAWADVRVVEGVHGPWMSGYVRPHITDDVVVVARASGVSGHWVADGRLKSVVSCNTRGFGIQERPDFKLSTDAHGNMVELVAGLLPCKRDDPAPPATTISFSTGDGQYLGSSVAPATWARFINGQANTSTFQLINMAGEVIAETNHKIVDVADDDEERERAVALLELEGADDDAV